MFTYLKVIFILISMYTRAVVELEHNHNIMVDYNIYYGRYKLKVICRTVKKGWPDGCQLQYSTITNWVMELAPRSLCKGKVDSFNSNPESKYFATQWITYSLESLKGRGI